MVFEKKHFIMCGFVLFYGLSFLAAGALVKDPATAQTLIAGGWFAFKMSLLMTAFCLGINWITSIANKRKKK
jgi:hypothetical protein